MSAVAATICPEWGCNAGPIARSTSALAGRLALVTEVGNLIELCQRGDAAAFQELFRRHRTDVARLVHRMLGPSAELEDVLQEVFLQVHRSIRDFKGNSLFSTWLYRVTVNVVL